MCYNLIMEKVLIAKYTEEAKAQLFELSENNQDKILAAVKAFEVLGIKYKNINNLGDGLFEIKPKGVRAYFMYDENHKKIIIIGLIVLKKTQKAPKQYIKQARKNIKEYIRRHQNDNE